MGVDCGKPDENSLMADKPSLVVEVLSPTTGGFDLTVKLAEYQALSSLDFILFVDTESPTVHLYRRSADRLWQDAVLKGLDALVELKKMKISVSLRDIYEGLQFRPKPKLAGGCRARWRVQGDLTNVLRRSWPPKHKRCWPGPSLLRCFRRQADIKWQAKAADSVENERGTLPEKLRKQHVNYHVLISNTATGLMVLEPAA